jgi:hypothetical protein
MVWRAAVAGYRAAFAVLTLVAIAVQAFSLAAGGGFDPGNFLGFFTIQSNLIAAAVFVAGAGEWRNVRTPRLDVVRGAAVVYMAVTGIVFFLLLRDIDVETRLGWVNSVVHEVMPIVVVVDWLIDPPDVALTARQGLQWLLYPLVGWYPYPFVNPANGGYARVALTCAAIALFMAVLCVAVIAVANARRHLSGTAAGRPTAR